MAAKKSVTKKKAGGAAISLQRVQTGAVPAAGHMYRKSPRIGTRKAAAPPKKRHETFYEMMKPFIGVIKNMPADWSENHDHYAWGAPKKRK